MGSSAKTPTEDPAAKALRKRQAEQMLQLDEEANTKIKRLFAASSGLRIARGSADSRMPAGNSTLAPGPADYGLKQSDARGYTRTGSPRPRPRPRTARDVVLFPPAGGA